jgi:aromatic-L-amino-acid/L-tryptophan decarboxylase
VTGELPGAWGWPEETLRAHGEDVLALALAHMAEQRDRAVFRPVPRALAERWRSEPWPADGCGPEELLAELELALEYPFGNGHPRFHAWVNPPPDRAGALAALAAAAANPSCAGGNQSALHLEREVIRWLGEMINQRSGGGGLLTSGGSMAAIVALGAARSRGSDFDVRADGLAGSPPQLVYASAEAHSSVVKAIELLGIGSRNLRVVPTDSERRIVPAELEAMVREDADGKGTPIAVVASAGTVNTGAIDPIEEIADVCAEQGLWLHVDGAYGAPAILTERYREALTGLARADSVALDPHKWLYVPVDAGALLVRDPEALREAFSLVPPYLLTGVDPDGVTDAPWISEFGIEQTRPFRALRVWAALRCTGRDGYRRLIDHDLDLAARLGAAVRANPALELVATGLSIVCFRYRAESERSGAVQRELARRIQLGGEAFLATTELEGRPALRACFVNPTTTEADVDSLVELVTATGAAAAADFD